MKGGSGQLGGLAKHGPNATGPRDRPAKECKADDGADNGFAHEKPAELVDWHQIVGSDNSQ